MEVKASARFLRLSPRKARLVTELIKGKSAEEAIAILENLPKSTSLPLGRVVRSAIANAENNFNLTLENLYVKRAIANGGARRKRVWYRGRGRRDLQVQRVAHLAVVLAESGSEA